MKEEEKAALVVIEMVKARTFVARSGY